MEAGDRIADVLFREVRAMDPRDLQRLRDDLMFIVRVAMRETARTERERLLEDSRN